MTQNKYNKCSAVAEIGDRLATTEMSQKLGGGYSVLGEPNPYLTRCGLH